MRCARKCSSRHPARSALIHCTLCSAVAPEMAWCGLVACDDPDDLAGAEGVADELWISS